MTAGSSSSGAGQALIVGIDLGTTNSLVAIVDSQGPRVLPDEQGRAHVPSVVRFSRGGEQHTDAATPVVEALVGHEAKHAAALFPRTTISSVKRLIGRSISDAGDDARTASYDIIAGPRGTLRVRVPLLTGLQNDPRSEAELIKQSDGLQFVLLSPEEVSARVLEKLKAIAERSLGQPVQRAVITVPAYFDDAQRQATRDAGRLAGLDVVRIVPEPTAAALAYGLGLPRSADRNRSAESYVAVYDLGGGTFDISILRITRVPHGGAEGTAGSPQQPTQSANDQSFYEVLATSGDTHLGGDDLDSMLAARLMHELEDHLGIHARSDLRLLPEAKRELLAAAEAAKILLTDVRSTTIRIAVSGFFRPEDAGTMQQASQVWERTITRDELDALALPLVQRTLEGVDRALKAARVKGLPTEPAAQVLSAVIMVGGMTRMPLVRKMVKDALGIEPYIAVDPDQVVALGAAVQASILAGNTKGSLLLDVIPLSLGLETVGGAVAKIIPNNASVPTSATEMFSTSVDNQTSVRLTVYQGEREMAADCRKLAEFHLRGIPPMPAGLPQVEVRFGVDANGVLSVAARERRSGRSATLQVVPNHGLTREEIERIERDSLLHARSDMRQHRVVDLVTNSQLDLKWITDRLNKLEQRTDRANDATLIASNTTDVPPRIDEAYASKLRELASVLQSFVSTAKANWQSVDANAFAKAKEELDRASVRLQEVSIAQSLREAAREVR